MTWNDGFLKGNGWYAWVQPHPREDGWTWEAVSLNASTCWQSAPTEAEAQDAALRWIAERAEDVAQRAAVVLGELGR